MAFCLSFTFPERVALSCSRFHPSIHMYINRKVINLYLYCPLCMVSLWWQKSHLWLSYSLSSRIQFEVIHWKEKHNIFEYFLTKKKTLLYVINNLDVHRSPGLHHSYMRTWCSNLQHGCKLTDKALLQVEPPLSNVIAAIQQQSHIDWAIWNKDIFTQYLHVTAGLIIWR